jgi:aminopeptidase N
LVVSEKYVGKNYEVTIRQEKPRKPGKYSNKVIPIKYKVFTSDGQCLQRENTLVLNRKTSSIKLKNLDHKPAISLLNSFSAPVLVEFEQPIDDLLSILEYETDFTSIWMAKKSLDYIVLKKIASNPSDAEDLVSQIYQILIKKLETSLLLAKLLELPSDNEYFTKLLETCTTVDPNSIQKNLLKCSSLYEMYFKEFSISYFKRFIDKKLYLRQNSHHRERALACALIFLNRDTTFLDDCINIIFNNSNNMSLQVSCLINSLFKKDENEKVNKFYLKYGKEKPLLNKWFSMQVQYSTPRLASVRLHRLTKHKDFNMLNPNNVNSLIGTFAKRNFHAFHQKDGTGYKVIADWIMKLDPVNPQIAANTSKAFEQIKFLPHIYREKAKATLSTLYDNDNLSKDTYEVLHKIKAF